MYDQLFKVCTKYKLIKDSVNDATETDAIDTDTDVDATTNVDVTETDEDITDEDITETDEDITETDNDADEDVTPITIVKNDDDEYTSISVNGVDIPLANVTIDVDDEDVTTINANIPSDVLSVNDDAVEVVEDSKKGFTKRLKDSFKKKLKMFCSGRVQDMIKSHVCDSNKEALEDYFESLAQANAKTLANNGKVTIPWPDSIDTTGSNEYEDVLMLCDAAFDNEVIKIVGDDSSKWDYVVSSVHKGSQIIVTIKFNN